MKYIIRLYLSIYLYIFFIYLYVNALSLCKCYRLMLLESVVGVLLQELLKRVNCTPHAGEI